MAVRQILALVAMYSLMYSLTCTIASASEAQWHAIPEESRLEFRGSVEHPSKEGPPMGVRAWLTEWQAELSFDPTHPELARLRVRMRIGSVRSSQAMVAETAMSLEFLDAEDHPEATYEAEGFQRVGEDRFATDGILTLREHEHPVRLEFTLNIADDRAIAEGAGLLNRFDFGVGTGVSEDMAQAEVEIRFKILGHPAHE